MTSSPTWARFQGVLISCLEKLVGIYRQTMREDRGDYDWSVLVKSVAGASQRGDCTTSPA